MSREGFNIMLDSDTISEELLNAYVDDELDIEERRRIEDAMKRDGRVRERVEELRSLKQLVRNAFIHETPTRSRAPIRSPWRVSGLAASLAAFALGVALTWGWFSYTDGIGASRIASAPESSGSIVAGQEQPVRVVFHLSREDPDRLQAILTEANALLETTSRQGRTAEVRIIASGNGLSLFEKGLSRATRRISEMKRAYPEHLAFNGCGLAYEQLKARQPDGSLELLPEVQLVDLGVLELMRRQRDGWAYIRI